MKNVLGKFVVFLSKTWVWSLCLVLLLAAIIWFAGPMLAVNDHRFWASTASRLLTLCILFLVWGLAMVFISWKAQAKKAEAEGDEAIQERLRRADQMSEEQDELRKRYKEALRTLRSSSLYQGRSEKWRNELPWYLIIGPEGSGKTSLLDFSGLEFPLNQMESLRLTKDVSGTRHADWYFAEHAVLVDTAGRYLTQKDAEIDGSAWHTLLNLLRQRRPQPLNGVLVNVPLDLLLNGGEQALEILARQTRQRLHEIYKRLGIDAPVYLVLSKADKVIGFDEFFDHMSREESDQVLGTSFRKDQNGTDLQVIRQEFEELLRRLNSQVILRMHQERDPLRRGRIFDFPRQLSQIGDKLCLFNELAFSGNRYQRASQLRGFYLTSAPQLEEKLDPTTVEIGRQLGISSKALPSFRRGRARFIHHLLSKVIFPEAALASLDQKEVRRIDWGQRALYAGALACLLLAGGGWAMSFSENHAHLEQLRAIAQALHKERKAVEPRDDAMQLLALLDTSYSATRVFPPRDEAAWSERGGLYQGPLVEPTLVNTYRHDLETHLLPRVARQLESQIRANMNDRERLLGSLRAYLMLHLPARRDATYLSEWLAVDWSLRYAGNSAVQNALNGHFRRLLDGPFAAVPVNEPLVTKARQVLRSESLANVVYRMLSDQAKSLPDYSFSQKLGPQGIYFSGIEYSIPGFYTQRGYQQYFIAPGASMVREILKDNWVLGEAEGEELSLGELRRLLIAVEQLYFRDYTNYWGEALARIALEPIGSALPGAEQLAALSAPNSPLLVLLQEIRDNTRFAGPAAADESSLPAEGVLGQAGQLAIAAAQQAQEALVRSMPDTTRRALERRFEQLHQLLDDDQAPTTNLAATLKAMEGMQQILASLARASASELAAFEIAKARMNNSQDAIQQTFANAARLPQPVSQWLSLMAEDSWMLVLHEAHSYINQRYQSELFEAYHHSLHQRYPFHAASESDVALADFRDFFKPQGIADSFFERYIKPFVITSGGQYQARPVDGHGLPLSQSFLTQLGKTLAIRRGFFSESTSEPLILFKLEPHVLDSHLSRADFRLGNQQMEYRHGPIVQTPFRWPSKEDDGRSSLVVEEIGGRRIGIEKNSGPWSMFRLLDSMEVDYHSGRDVLLLKAQFDGMPVHYLLHGQRSSNPFDVNLLRSFRLPTTL